MKLRERLSRWLCPEVHVASERYRRLHDRIVNDKYWFAHSSFPGFFEAYERLQVDDHNYWRPLGDPPLETKYPTTIHGFRDWLQEELNEARRRNIK